MKELKVILSKLHDGQIKVKNESKRFNVLCCGRRWGKSKFAVNLLCETAIDGFPAGYFTPTYKLLEGTFNDCLKALQPIVSRKHDNKKIELITGGSIEFWSLDNEYAGRSRKYKRAILDEVAFAKNLWDVWMEAVRPTLTDLKGDGWLLSTPKGKNDFHKFFVRGKSEEHWMSWQMPTSTNPYIDKSEIDDAQKDMPQLAFAQEYLAEFSENIANPFGTNFIKQCTFELSKEPVICYGIDLAKSHDYTVIIGLDRFGSVAYLDRFQKDWRQTKLDIMALPRAPILIDSTGVGDPIFEDLYANGMDIEGFKYTQTGKQQLMEGLASAIQQRKITFPEGVITEELNIFEYQFSATGVKYSAPQGYHDDAVNSLALSWKKFTQNNKLGQYSFA